MQQQQLLWQSQLAAQGGMQAGAPLPMMGGMFMPQAGVPGVFPPVFMQPPPGFGGPNEGEKKQ